MDWAKEGIVKVELYQKLQYLTHWRYSLGFNLVSLLPMLFINLKHTDKESALIALSDIGQGKEGRVFQRFTTPIVVTTSVLNYLETVN